MKETQSPDPHKKKRVLFFSPLDETFIDVDRKILESRSILTYLFAQGFSAVIRILANVPKCDVVLCWFGSVYSAVAVWAARILGKRSVIIVAGVDAVAVKEINYGIWLNPWKSVLVRYAMRYADSVLVVAPSMKENLKHFARYDGRNIHYVAFGFDVSVWREPIEPRNGFVLTVGKCDSKMKLLKKGIDYICLVAEQMPERRFVVVGADHNLLVEHNFQVPDNVEVVKAIPQDQLHDFYARCGVYCQPSRSEGMPNTLCEAMASGCIPVGTNVDGIPTAIGDTGHIVELGDISGLVVALKTALAQDQSDGLAARRRIASEFPMEKRIRLLCEHVLGEDILTGESS